MQHKQVCIAAYQNIRLGDQSKHQKRVVFGIAAGQFGLAHGSIRHDEQMYPSSQVGDENPTFFPNEITIELAAVEHFLKFSKCFGTGAEIPKMQSN